MSKRKLNYAEGDVFVFPLREDEYGKGFARGVVVRMDNRKSIIGYFFGPRLKNISEAVVDKHLIASNAIHIQSCGNLGLVAGHWTVIGKILPWERSDWPNPVFGFINPLIEGRGELRCGELRCKEEGTFNMIIIKRVSVEEVKGFPSDGHATTGAIEGLVNRALHREENLCASPLFLKDSLKLLKDR